MVLLKRGNSFSVCLVILFLSQPFFSYSEGGERDKSELVIASASDLQFAMGGLIKAFEDRYPDVKIKVSYGSSGNFFSQIKNGAPFHIFFSADMIYPERLANEGYSEGGAQPLMYGMGKVVIWVQRSSTIDVERLKFESLLHPSVKKIAIANPDHAPYGRAAKESLLRSGIFENIKVKLVMGENISQAAQFVQSGAADIGLIALSIAMSSEMRENGRYWEIPDGYHNPLRQGFLLLKGLGKNKMARLFADFVKGADGISILRKYGFIVTSNQ
ncbi:MAG: molybdate ABC transporter substrate-binding protein [Nitrospinae bacterium]|nr:molybdate ABC transporter substrate-binding protein [Nitrospinota bacterium]